MRGCDDGKDPARIRKRVFKIRPHRSEITAHGATPHIRIGFGVIQMASPDAITIGVLLPVPTWIERLVGVSATPACDAGTAPPFEGKRLHDLYPIAPAEGKGARVSRGGERVAPNQEALRAGPDTVQHTPLAIFAQQVAIAITQKAARTCAELHQACRFFPCTRPLLLANVGLMVRQAEMLGPVLGGNFHRLAAAQRCFNHALGCGQPVKISPKYWAE